MKLKVFHKWSLSQIRHLNEVIRKGAFGGTYFRNIFSGVTEKWYRKSQKEFYQLKYIDQKYYFSSYYDVSVNKYDVKCGTSLRFRENKGWINEIDLMDGFRGILYTGWVEDQNMMKDKLIDGMEL